MSKKKDLKRPSRKDHKELVTYSNQNKVEKGDKSEPKKATTASKK